MKFTEIGSRLTGFSTPVFGVSWEPATSDMAAARQVIVFLEDRRVLYVPSEVEMAEHCIQSVIEIRRFLTEIIGRGGLHEELTEHLRAIRAACRQFAHRLNPKADTTELLTPDRWRSRYHGIGLNDYELNQALGELRGIVGLHIGAIASSHGIDLEDDTLASILPARDS